jgi:predicted acetyltransferase
MKRQALAERDTRRLSTVTWAPRLIEPDELPAVIDLVAIGFGAGPTAPPDHRAAVTAIIEVDRTFVVEDGGRPVGTGAALSFAVALPGSGTVPLAGVTEVVVSPTHRRRGVLSTLIETVHDQAIERGEPLAGLTASEGGIYRRFGYGVAARYQSVTIDAARSAEVTLPTGAPVPTPAGSMRLVSEAEADTILPAVWERHWRRTPGEVDRTPGWWAEMALDTEHARDGASARFLAVHDDETGTPDGFVTYRIAQGFGVGGTNHELRILDVAAASDAVEAALLRFVLDIDLVGTVTWEAPVDMPLRWRLADPRALTVTAERDLLWLRPLDVTSCLAARRYAASGGLTIEVVDERRAGVGGRFRLDSGTDGAECTRTDREPDLVVGMPELGAVLVGGTTWHTVRRAGLVDERSAGAVDRADALFRTERAAYCATDF